MMDISDLKIRILISFSGGESSAFMLIQLWNRYKDRLDVEMLVCFANTGDEEEETLIFVEKVSKVYSIPVTWLEAYVSPVMGLGVMPVIVDFDIASRDGTPLLDQSEKVGACGISTPHCTRDLKIRCIQKYAKAYFEKQPFYTAMGMRFDEQIRIDWDKANRERFIYPLVNTFRVYKADVRTYWRKHKEKYGWRLNLQPHQGNCVLCHKKEERKLVRLIREKPCRAIFRMTLTLVSATDEYDMYRGHCDIWDLLEKAKSDTPEDLFSSFGGSCFCG